MTDSEFLNRLANELAINPAEIERENETSPNKNGDVIDSILTECVHLGFLLSGDNIGYTPEEIASDVIATVQTIAQYVNLYGYEDEFNLIKPVLKAHKLAFDRKRALNA